MPHQIRIGSFKTIIALDTKDVEERLVAFDLLIELDACALEHQTT